MTFQQKPQEHFSKTSRDFFIFCTKNKRFCTKNKKKSQDIRQAYLMNHLPFRSNSFSLYLKRA